MEQRLHVVEPGQWRWAFCVMAIVGAFVYSGEVLPAIAAAVLGYAGFHRFSYGPGYKLLGDMIVSRWRRMRRRGQMLKPPPVTVKGKSKPKSEPRKGRPPIPLRALALTLPKDGYDFGVIHNLPAGTDTARVSGRGWHGVALDFKDRYNAENVLVDCVRQAVQQYDGPVGVSMAYLSRPLNIERSRDWELQNLQNAVIDVPEESYANPQTAVEVFAANNRQLEVIKQKLGRDVIMSFGLTIPRPTGWPKDETKLTARQIEVAPIVRLTKILEEGMARNGVDRAEILDFIDTKTYIRMAWDIAGIEQWYSRIANLATAERLAILDAEVVDEVHTRTEAEIDADEPWPRLELRTGPNYLAADGTFHRVLRVVKQRHKVLPGDFTELFFANVGPADQTGLTIGLCGQTVSAQTEMRWLNRGIVWREGIRRAQDGGKDLYESMAKRERRQRLVQRQDRIYLGGNQALAYNTYVVVSATSLELLETAEDAVLAHCRGVGIRVKRVTLESRQVQAFFMATLGTTMM
ncbi:MAG: hypothetical protein NVSMB39_2320 [Candidatus Saccharimonadales bacterium]